MTLLVITPFRNEAAHVRSLVESVAAQTETSFHWLLLDDGSSDGGAEAFAEQLAMTDLQYEILSLRPPDEDRRVGAGVAHAVNRGIAHAADLKPDLILKLDADVILPSAFVESLVKAFATDPGLGSCSGAPYVLAADGTARPEACGPDTTVGMTKAYRSSALMEIGGLPETIFWDVIDCHLLRQNGWRVQQRTGPTFDFIHKRQMGSSDRGVLRGRRRNGGGQWVLGTAWWYMLAVAVRRLFEPPIILGSLASLAGYGINGVRRTPRYGDSSFRRSVRGYHRSVLLVGKRRAVNRAELPAATRFPQR